MNNLSVFKNLTGLDFSSKLIMFLIAIHRWVVWCCLMVFEITIINLMRLRNGSDKSRWWYLIECRQQIDIPEPKTIGTEYRQMRVTCCCGLEHNGEFPVGVTPNASYGARIKVLSLLTSPKSPCKSIMLPDGNTIDFISFFRLVGNR